MKNPRTKQSRGYGFVSFTRPDDAKTALDQLNGKYILGKPVVIAYHEPKRHTTTTNDNNAASPIVSPAIAITTPPLPITYQQQKSVTEASTLALGNKFTKYGKIDHRHYHAACAATTAVPASSTLKAHMTPQTQNVVSSPPSSSSSSSYYAANKDTGKCGSQRDRVRVAILNIINKNNNIGIDTLDHWVDYIMSLRPTSRALCLFNPAYLEAKLEEKPCLEQDQRTLSQANHHHPGHTPKTPNLVQPSDHHSHASSSTTLSSAAVTTTTSATDIVNMQDLGEQQRHSSIALFVESIKGLSLIQQKQHLGDLLFPYVKATGTKQASKVTIHLLDTQPLEQLAYSMHSMDLLKPLVDKAILTLTRQQNFIKAVMKK
ncbi:hypothetical protein BC941DRAFT_431731 [Chlamydoabsidia padenii]|nr:hypothetical protein BC941DRAFT_431731 [Chlamydoabsidia padenii]